GAYRRRQQRRWPRGRRLRAPRPGGPGDVGRPRRRPRQPGSRRTAPASTASGTTSALQPLPGLDHLDEGIDEVVVGRDHVEVDAGPAGRVADGDGALLAGAAKPPPELRVAGLHHQLLTRLRALAGQDAAVGTRE